MPKLHGKVAIVTGAARGIGEQIAKALARDGASVVVNYATSQADAERVVAEITRADGKALAVQGDLAKAADVTRLFAETKRVFGRLDVLVNNAAVYSFAPLEQVTEAEFHRHFDANVLGVLLATRESLKYFGPQGGSVINVSSVVATNPLPTTVVYSATKGAVDTITRGLAAELGSRHIRVNAVSPGPTLTEGAKRTGFFDEANVQALAGRTPLGRIGQPEDIAPAVAFLASDESSWVTGEIIRVAGGLT